MPCRLLSVLAFLLACLPTVVHALPPYKVVVVTGQSLGAGEQGLPVVSTAQPYGNRKVYDASAPGTYGGYDGSGDALSLVPLTAPLRTFYPLWWLPYTYPVNTTAVETPGVGFCNQLTADTGADCIETNVAESGHGMTHIKKGGTGNAYAGSLYEVAAIVGLAAAEGRAAEVVGVFLVAGEADTADPAFGADVDNLQADYDADLRAITGQAAPIPMLLSPQSTLPTTLWPSVSTLAAWQLARAWPDRFVMVGPKYQYHYVDGLHLDGPGYRRLGEQAAHALTGSALMPQSVAYLGQTPDGFVYQVTFDVPVEPLQWCGEPSHAGTVWQYGRGFELSDDTGPIEIYRVEIIGDTVELTVAAKPPHGVLSYAMWQDAPGFNGGAAVGRHGELCDSDAFLSYSARTAPAVVHHGSPFVDAVAPGDFWDVGRRQLAGGFVLDVTGDTITLSEPWAGASGEVELLIQNDHRNRAVPFSLGL